MAYNPNQAGAGGFFGHARGRGRLPQLIQTSAGRGHVAFLRAMQAQINIGERTAEGESQAGPSGSRIGGARDQPSQEAPAKVRQQKVPHEMNEVEKHNKCVAIYETKTIKLTDNTSSMPNYQLKWLFERYDDDANFERALTIAQKTFLNRLLSTKTRMNGDEFERTVQALLRIQRSPNYRAWYDIFDRDSSILRSFVLQQIILYYLNDEMSDELLQTLFKSALLTSDNGFRKMFPVESWATASPANMANVEPSRDKPDHVTKQLIKRRREFETAYSYKGDDVKVKKNLDPLSFHFLLWLLETDTEPLAFANKLQEWQCSFEKLIGLNRNMGMKMSTIANVILAVWRLESSGIQDGWFANVSGLLTNFVIFQIAPAYLYENLPSNIIEMMLACRMFRDNFAFCRLFGLPIEAPVEEEEGAVGGIQ